jgi:hypothetical protein
MWTQRNWHIVCDSPSMRTPSLILIAALACLPTGCQELEEARTLPELDASAYRCEVEPVLIARCAFYPCHGSNTRPFHVFGVNRMRFNPPLGNNNYVINQPLTAEEQAANHSMALAFAEPGQHDDSLLLLKPLDADAGGYYHQGKGLYGNRDVFSSVDDPGYVAIEGWLNGGTRADDCVPREEVGR